jgi:hypothetical protein
MLTSRFLLCYFYSYFNSHYLVVNYNDPKFLSLLLSLSTTLTGTCGWPDANAHVDRLDRGNMGKAAQSTRAHTSLDKQVTRVCIYELSNSGFAEQTKAILVSYILCDHVPYHHLLTFKNRASYIYDGRIATLQMLHFMYFFNKCKY